MPFRDAHKVIGELVVYCISKDMAIDDLNIDELKKFSELFDEDVYEEISLKTCVEKRLTFGGCSEASVLKTITEEKKFLNQF